jgi:hypothetical protein
LPVVTEDHPIAFAVVATPAPTAQVSGVGVGVGVGFGDGATGTLDAVHPVTLISGTVSDDENATERAAGAFTWNGTVRLTAPFVKVAALGAGVCARSGAKLAEAKISAIRNEITKCNLLFIVDPL